MSSKNEITIVDIPSPGMLGGVFSDLILALTHSINLLGFKVNYERRLARCANPVIVFGLYREFINASPQIKLPPNYFVFNLAPIIATEAQWFENYIRFISRHSLIDYSYSNISRLREIQDDSKPAHIFNFGYFDLMPFRGFARDGDYLFYGKLNEDRTQRLQSFRDAGLRLTVLQNSWGHERDMQIRRARAIVNIGKYSPNILEVYRIWHSLCLGTPVYSDAGADDALAKLYSKYVNLSDRLEPDSFLTPPVSPDIYQSETSFTESTVALLDFIKHHT